MAILIMWRSQILVSLQKVKPVLQATINYSKLCAERFREVGDAGNPRNPLKMRRGPLPQEGLSTLVP